MAANPALAVASSPFLSNPAAMAINHPGAAFLGVPEMYNPATMQPPTNGGPAPGPGGVMMPRMTTMIGTQAVANGFPGANSAPGHPTIPILTQVPGGGIAPTPSAAIAGTTMDPNLMAIQGAQRSTLGGVPIPALPPNSSTAMQVQVAAAAAAAAAAPLKNAQGHIGVIHNVPNGNSQEDKGCAAGPGGRKRSDLTPAEKAKQNRDRNREHARSTRLRKKAYVQKLKELVEGLHAERTEEVRKRRVAVQHLAEVQGVRRAVVRSFLRSHSNFESDSRKWMTLLEDDFWLKQPVTPYRSFRRAEVQHECRISRGVDAMVADAASVAVMIAGVGSRSTRWLQIKREEVLNREEMRVSSQMPHSIAGRNESSQNGVSSLSSSSGSSNGSGGEEDRRQGKRKPPTPSMTSSKDNETVDGKGAAAGTKKVSSSSGSSSESRQQQSQSNDYHDYHAPALPDPKLGDSQDSSPDSQEESNASARGDTKQVSTDSSSSGEDDKSDRAVKPVKRRKMDDGSFSNGVSSTTNSDTATSSAGAAAAQASQNSLPANIAKSGGISHNIRPVVAAQAPVRNGSVRLSAAPAIQLPPFLGIGKRPAPTQGIATASVTVSTAAHSSSAMPAHQPRPAHASGTGGSSVTLSRYFSSNNAAGGGTMGNPSIGGGPSIIAPDVDSSSNSSNNSQQIRAYYHVNEDDMILTEDVLMCPFIFRSQDAVLCGALAECVMPGMLRAQFSQRNKLVSFEMVYDAMGFMQQLERASGSDGVAQVVPGSLEMALAPNTDEARVITLAKPPFLIVSVNEAWARATKYTQMEVEGKDLSILNGPRTVPDGLTRSGQPMYKFEEIAKGLCACCTNVHYDKEGKEFVDFICSYPLTNANDNVTHILHVFKELPPHSSPTHEFRPENGGSINGSDCLQNN